MIKCPKTGQAVYTGIETDQISLSRAPDVPMQARCHVAGSTSGGSVRRGCKMFLPLEARQPRSMLRAAAKHRALAKKNRRAAVGRDRLNSWLRIMDSIYGLAG
jgi:hypothetical protein